MGIKFTQAPGGMVEVEETQTRIIPIPQAKGVLEQLIAGRTQLQKELEGIERSIAELEELITLTKGGG